MSLANTVQSSLHWFVPIWYKEGMKLSDYIRERGLTLTAFGQQIGVTHATVHRYISQGRIPEPDVMREIIKVTGGVVTANDFFDEAPAA